MPHRSWVGGLGVITLSAAAPLVAQRAVAPPGWPALVRAFEAYARADSVVGASVLLLEGGRLVARHDYGFADRALGQRVDARTIFHWGSITKTLTAVAILQLRDHGRLSLDDAITRWIPELRQVHDSFGSVDAVTIRMLLSHSAGFQDPTWPYKAGKPWEPFEPTRWEQLVAMMPYQEIYFRPGSRYGYSNPAFIYLARVLEQVTGDPYEAYVYKNLWLPLGITHSYFGVTPYALQSQRSNNYDVVKDSTGWVAVIANGRDFDPGITIPNGGWNASLDDVARWVAFLTAAAGGGDTVLRSSSLEEMWRPVVATADSTAPGDSVGLSFFVLHRGGVRVVGHTGHQARFRSFFYLNPRTRAAVIATFNTTNDVDPARSEAGFRGIRDEAVELIAR